MSNPRDFLRGLLVKTSPDDASAQLERLLAKQKYKDAVKQAKLIHKANPTAQNHKQLEVVYFLRAQQLLSAGLVSSAVEVAQHLLEFGVTDTKLREELPPFLVKVGLAKDAFRVLGQTDPDAAPAQNRLLLLAADQAVLHPERVQSPSPELGQEAAKVRQAIESLYTADEATALGLVRDISRISPLADWKLLVRGLAAFYRGDDEETQANWSRLDQERAAIKIARQLQKLRDGQPDQAGDASTLQKLENLVFQEPILARLRELGELVAKDHWPDAVRRIGPLRISLGRIDHRLAERLTASLIEPLLDRTTCITCKSGMRLLRDFMHAAQPLDIDPTWNRLWAIAWQRSCDGDTKALEFWNRYIEDLKTRASLKPEDRSLAQALVLNHVAEYLLGAIEEDDEPDREKARLARQVRESIERSLELASRHRPTHDLLIRLCKALNDPAELAQARKRVLEVFPDDLETLVEMAENLNQRDEHESALELLSRARKLKPLDRKLIGLEIMVRTALARSLAMQRRWDEGRAQFALIEQIEPEELKSFRYLTRKATFEAKAGQVQLVDRYEREAASLLPEPAPLLMSLYIESIRFKLTKAVQKSYAEIWKKELKKKCRSESAGAMAGHMSSYLALNVRFDHRDQIAAEVLAYVRRTIRVNYRLEDLEEVIGFLGQFKTEGKLAYKLAERGLKAHPKSVILHLAAASFDPGGTRAMNRAPVVRNHLQQALKLAEASTRRLETQLLPQIKQMLSVHDEVHSRLARSPFGPPGAGPASMDEFLEGFMQFMQSLPVDEFEADDDDNDDDYDDDDSVPFFSRAFSARRPSRRPSRGKRKS